MLACTGRAGRRGRIPYNPAYREKIGATPVLTGRRGARYPRFSVPYNLRIMKGPTMADPTWDELVAGYMQSLADEDRSDNTVRAYRDDLGQFARWYADRDGRAPELAELVKRDLLAWREHLESRGGNAGRPASASTVARKMSAVKSFFAWCRDQDKGVRFEPPKARRQRTKPEPKSLSVEEQRALLKAAEVAQDPRDIAILQVGLEGGLRVSEMEAQEVEDIKIGERKGTMHIREGKGRTERRIPLSRDLRLALLEHLGGRRRGPLFEGRDGPLCVSSLQKIACKYAAAAQVGRSRGIKGFSIHRLRHTCARRLIEAGWTLPDVAAFLGHADIKTTMRYVASGEEALSRAMARLDGEG